MEVVPGLHWIERIWDTKVYVLFKAERVIVIDAATPGRAAAVWRYLDSLGYAPEMVDEIWLTHADIDHMGSVAALKAGSGARVVAHRADAPLVDGSANRELGPVPLSGGYQRLFNWAVRNLFRYQPTPVDRLVDDGEDLGSWQVVHTPGHTPDSMCIHVKDELVTGDTLFVGKIGGTATRKEAETEFQSLMILMEMEPHIRIWPGHNYGVAKSSTIGHELETNPFLQRLDDFSAFYWLKQNWADYKLRHGIK